MKIHDQAQNLGIRVGTIQVAVFVLLAILGVRLYYLQVVKGEYYSDKAENQRIRMIPIPAPRGAIFDRNGKLLVDSRPTYNVTLSNEPIKKVDTTDRVDDYARGLGVDGVELLFAVDGENRDAVGLLVDDCFEVH